MGLNLSLQVRSIVVIGNAASVLEGIMHGKLLLEVSDLLLIAFDHQMLIKGHVNGCVIAHTHHASGKLKGRYGFLKVAALGPDIGDHHCLAVAAEGIAEEVGQAGLTIGDVVS